MHASHSFKTLPRKLMSIEEYLATKGLANRSAKPVLTLVPSPTPSKAALAELNRREVARLNSPLAMARHGLCEATATTAYSGERIQVRAPDDEKNDSYGRRIDGCSFRNAGRKPYRHATHVRRVKFGIKRLPLN